MAEQARIRKKPRGFYGWYMVGFYIVLHFWVSVTHTYGFQAFFNPLLNHFGWTRAMVAGAFSLRSVESSFLGPVIGFLTDRLGAGRVLVGGMFILGMGMILLSRIGALWHFYLVFIFITAGMGTINLPISAAIVNWFVRKRGRALAVLFLGGSASGLGVPLVVYLVNELGWRVATVLLGLSVWLICIPLSALIRHRPQPYGYLPDGDDPNAASQSSNTDVSKKKEAKGAAANSLWDTGGDTRVGLTAKQALRMPVFWLLTAILAIIGMGFQVVVSFQIPYLESLGYTTQAAASTVGFFTVFSGFSRVGVGFLMDYVDKRLVILGIVLCQVLGFIVLLNVTAYWMIVLFAAFSGIAMGATLPARPILISEFFGTRHFGTIAGLEQGFTVVAGISTPLIMGFSFDLTGSYKPGLLIITIITLALVPVIMALPKRKGLVGVPTA